MRERTVERFHESRSYRECSGIRSVPVFFIPSNKSGKDWIIVLETFLAHRRRQKTGLDVYK